MKRPCLFQICVCASFGCAILLFGACSHVPDPVQTPGQKAISLSFHPLTAAEQSAFREFCVQYGSDSDSADISRYCMMELRNNGYDSLFACLHVADSGHIFYRSDRQETYAAVQDTLVLYRREDNYIEGCDSTLYLGRNQLAQILFRGICKDSLYCYRYHFAFKADSAGKKVYPQFLRFPCEEHFIVRK